MGEYASWVDVVSLSPFAPRKVCVLEFIPFAERNGLPPVFWSTQNGSPLGIAKYEHVLSSVYSD